LSSFFSSASSDPNAFVRSIISFFYPQHRKILAAVEINSWKPTEILKSIARAANKQLLRKASDLICMPQTTLRRTFDLADDMIGKMSPHIGLPSFMTVTKSLLCFVVHIRVPLEGIEVEQEVEPEGLYAAKAKALTECDNAQLAIVGIMTKLADLSK